MSSCLEFEGKAVDDAVKKASETLNIPKTKLKYSIISHGSSGIFGLVGVKKAKICVTLSKEKAAAKKESDKQDSYIDEDSSESITSLVNEAFNLTEKTPPKDAPKKVEKPEKPAASPESINAAVELGKEVLQRIIDFITSDAAISVVKMEDRILFNVEGGNAGVLIGKRGQTLEAIQYLVEKVVNKHNAERIRIQIDVEGYLDNRRASLEDLARRLAEKTKTTGRPSTMGQMNAHDRRIVHLTLKDNNAVRTQSIGDGFYRKLVIFPKKNHYRKKRSTR